MALLTATNLTQTYGNKIAVDKLSLHIDTGELIAFLGPNGAGKTTTLKMLTGITHPKAGQVSINGIYPNSAKYQHQIGVVFQDSVLDANLTVKQNLMLKAKMYKNYDEKFLDRLITLFNVNNIIKQKYGTLSGGQKRRIDIIRALINKPKILFLDEPTTGLDIQTRNKIWEVLNQLRQEIHLTIVLTTHYLEETNQADYVYVIDHGQIIAQDTVQNLRSKYSQHVLTLVSDQVPALKEFLKSEFHPRINHNQVVLLMPNLSTTLKLLNQVQPFINDMQYRNGDMNDVFIALTGKEIR